MRESRGEGDRQFATPPGKSQSLWVSMISIWTPPPGKSVTPLEICVCFVALRPKSTAMVIAGRSVHLTTLFPGQA